MRMLGILSGMLSIFSFTAIGQTTDKNEISIRTLEYKQKGDSVYLTYQINPSKRLKSWDGYVIRCFIEKGDSIHQIDSLQLRGKYSYIHALRNEQPAEALYKYDKDRESLTPFIQFKYKEWMRAESIQFQISMMDCCTPESRLISQIQSPAMEMEAIPVPESYAMDLQYSFITPEAKPIKDLHNSGSAFLEFPVGKSELLIDFKNNKFELAKIHGAIDSIVRNKYAQITGVDLIGYASIDGNSKSNFSLSLSRAESVRRFLLSAYPKINQKEINARAGGEDWIGLRKLCQDLSFASGIDPIFNLSVSDDVKENKIKQLSGGGVYRMLLAEVFPKLRRVDYTVRFTVKGLTIEESKDLLKTAPGNLSLNELFLLANTYVLGSSDFQEVFDIAVRLYPNDPVARINAASIALARKDIERASGYLSGLEKDKRALNNLALLRLTQGRIAEAKVLLEQACSLNDSSACHNKQEVAKYMDVEKHRTEIIRKNEGGYEK